MTSMLSTAIQEKSSVLLLLTPNRGVMGGLLTLNSFVTVFPDIDTTKSSSSTSSNATTQGMHLNANLLLIHILIDQESRSLLITWAVSSAQSSASGLETTLVAVRQSLPDPSSWSSGLRYKPVLTPCRILLSAVLSPVSATA